MINLGVLQVVLKAKDQLSGKIKSVAGVAIVAAAAIAKFTKDTIDLGTELVDLQSKTGVGIQSLQEFQFAGAQAGVGMKVMSDSILRLGRRAAAELPETTKFLNKVGLSVEDITSRKPGEAFALVAEKLKAMGPGAEQAAAAMGILGDAGLSILPAINQGIQGNVERFRELGSAMSDEAAMNAKKLGDSLTDLNARWTGIKTTIGSVVIPALQNIIIFFSDLLPGAIQTTLAFSARFVVTIIRNFRDAAAAIAIFDDSFVGVADSLGNIAHKVEAFAAGQEKLAAANWESFGQSITGSVTPAAVAIEAANTGVAKLTQSLSFANLEMLKIGPVMTAAVIEHQNFGIAVTGVGDLVDVETSAMAGAYQRFGLKTKTQLDQLAAQARVDFALISQDGKFSATELDTIWAQYEANRQQNAELTTQVSLESGANLVAGAFGQLAQLGGAFKLFAVGQAIISTALSVSRALAGPPPFPWSIPVAAAAGIAGAVQIGKINSQKGFATGTPGLDFQDFGGASATVLHGPEAVIPQGGGHQLAREIAEAGGGGTRELGMIRDELRQNRHMLEQLPRTFARAVRDAMGAA